MSGDSEAPPTYYFNGITFNPDFYQAASGDYLTFETAKSSFLTYPTAQGSETITTLNSSTINTSTLASTGLITANGISNTGTISSTGNITSSGGSLIGAYQNSTLSATSTISSLGAITGSSLALGSGAITSGAITSSGLITANNGLTVPSGKAMTASGTLVASIGTISGNTAVVSYSGNTPTLVGGSYNINLLVILTGAANKTITLMNPIANQTIIFRARMTGGTTITVQANNSASIIYPLERSVLSSSVVLTSITSSLTLISDGTNWYEI